MMNAPFLNRRGFLVATTAITGGMALGLFPANAAADGAAIGPWAADSAVGNEFTPWLEISRDSIVTVRVPQQEVGNGTVTQMAMNVAEELGCKWADIRTEFASMNRNFLQNNIFIKGFLPTFGGHATSKERMAHSMQLGASARERLKAAAAARWKVPAAEITAAESLLTHSPSGRKLSYGDVAADAATIKLEVEPKLKPQTDWWLIGKQSPPKLNVPAIATGQLVFGIDVKVPGMVHAALMQAPVQGGRLKSHQPEAVLKMPGVRAVVVVDPANSKKSPVKTQTNFGLTETAAQHGVAVIADHFWQAKTALEALPVEWDLGPGAALGSADDLYAAMVKKRDGEAGKPLKTVGDVSVAKGRAVEADYLTPYAENAVLEPLNATARVTADRAEVWAPTQDSRQAFWTIVDETGMAPETVHLHPTYVGGGFGRRTQSEDIRMAVAVARAYPGVPVKTIWTREETFRQGRYRTPVATRMKAVLNEKTGLPDALTGNAMYAGDRPIFQIPQGFTDPPYYNGGAIPNVLLTQNNLPVHVLNGAYRGPCFNSHSFITESFIDECAHAAGQDPLQYRLKLLAHWDPSWAKCLNVVAEKIGWGRKLPKGEGLGIAITGWPVVVKNAGSICAAAAHVAVSPEGELKIRQMDISFDCGRVSNADFVRAQVEGGAIFALNMTLLEEMTLKDGAMVEGNFDAYPMLKMADIPPINVHFDALSGHDRFDIMGEVVVGPVGPAVANAIYMATGKRLRSTPIQRHDLKWA